MNQFTQFLASCKLELQKIGNWVLRNRRNRKRTGLILALIPVLLWVTIHSPIANSISIWSLFFTIPVAFFIFSLLYTALLSSVKRSLIHAQTDAASPLAKRLTSRSSLFVMSVIIIPMILILSLLFIDLISFIAQVPPSKLYDGEYTFLTSLYFGTFAVLGFSVSAYVASVRHRSLRQSEKHLEYTQQKDRESEVDRRMLEGIKLLGDKNESVRLGGIYILWEIVKDAVKALPYLDSRHYNVYYHRYKDYPIIPYITDKPLPVSETRGQRRLKELYMQANHADQSQIKAYLKAFSLYEQVLSILCGHIRTLTNTEEYLLTYYPSIAKVRYSRAYAERYDDDSRVIPEKEEEPGNEIAILFRLLSKKEYSRDKPLVRALNFKMNLASSILKGVFSDHADLTNANLRNVNFTYARMNYVTFDQASCIYASFNGATLNISSFTMADCTGASFINAQITNTTFKYANCIRVDFTNIFHKAYFYGTTMLHTKFSYDDFMNNRIEFLGINGLPGFANATSLEREPIIELVKEDEVIYLYPNDTTPLLQHPELYAQYQKLLEAPKWRVPILEAKFAHETLMRSGSNQQPGESYSGHRSLEQIKTRDNLAVFHRMFKEQGRNNQAFYESLNEKEKILVTRMFSDFDQSMKRDCKKGSRDLKKTKNSPSKTTRQITDNQTPAQKESDSKAGVKPTRSPKDNDSGANKC